jgi:rhodanese-related sulfurtransferase
MMTKTLIKEIFIILLLAGLTAFVVNGLRDEKLPLFAPPDRAYATSEDRDITGSVQIRAISTQEAIDGFKKGLFLFVDARSESEFDSGHIQGAVNLPEAQFDQRIGGFLEKTDPQVSIITYCAGYYCRLAERLAEKLILAGFENVYYLPDGWGNWNKFRMPVEMKE